MNTTYAGALYVVLPALLLLLAPSVMRAYEAVSVSIRALYTAVRTMRVPASIKVYTYTVVEPVIVLLSYIVVTTCPYVAPNAYLRAFYRAYNDDITMRYHS